jgi:hypothetical protein
VIGPSASALLAAPSGEAAKSGPWGLAIILLLCVGCYFLFKSMSKHMRKVREQFPVERADRAPARPSEPTRPDQLPTDGHSPHSDSAPPDPTPRKDIQPE